MQVRGGVEADDVSLYAMCRQWVQNAVDVDAGHRLLVPVRHPLQAIQGLRSACMPLLILQLPLLMFQCWCAQEVAVLKLPPPLVGSTELGRDPPKEVALLQDEETLFLDEDTLPAEVSPPQDLAAPRACWCPRSGVVPLLSLYNLQWGQSDPSSSR